MTAQVYHEIRAHAQRDDLIMGHLSLVRHIVGRLAARLPHGVDLENLEAAGTLGLVEAANRYEPARGIHFKTFAYPRIRGAIYDELRRNCPLPQELLERAARVREVLESMPPPVAVEVLAQRTGLTEDDVTECLAALRLTRVISWNEASEPSQSQAKSFHLRPESNLEEAERKRLLVEAITTLPENERVAVTLYYMEDLRLKEIGRVLNLSESRVSRLLKAAEQKLEEHIRAREDGAPV